MNSIHRLFKDIYYPHRDYRGVKIFNNDDLSTYTRFESDMGKIKIHRPTISREIRRVISFIEEQLEYGSVESIYITKLNISVKIAATINEQFETPRDCREKINDCKPAEKYEFRKGTVISGDIVYIHESELRKDPYLSELRVKYPDPQEQAAAREETEFTFDAYSERIVNFYEFPKDLIDLQESYFTQTLYPKFTPTVPSSWSKKKTLVHVEREDESAKLTGEVSTNIVIDPTEDYKV